MLAFLFAPRRGMVHFDDSATFRLARHFPQADRNQQNARRGIECACQPQHRCAVALHQAGQPVVQQNGRERASTRSQGCVTTLTGRACRV